MTEFAEIKERLGWLVDVPLFIDEERVSSLYDVTSQTIFNEYQVQQTEQSESEQQEESSTVEGSIEAGVKGNSVLSFVTGGSLLGRVRGEHTTSDAETLSRQYLLRQTPQRQLAQIVLQYYQSTHKDTNEDDGETDDVNRSFEILKHRAEFDWDDINRDISQPRPLVVLQLPGIEEIHGTEEGNEMETILVPAAAEFADGEVVPIYRMLEGAYEKPPRYPQREYKWSDLGNTHYNINPDNKHEKIGDDIREARRKYWNWFIDNFDPKEVTRTIEEVAAEHGDVRWLAFRLPLDQEGQTLHLTIKAREQYSIGTFAYNFVKRGHKHGLTLVGTLKSEPDMDVLAIYER